MVDSTLAMTYIYEKAAGSYYRGHVDHGKTSLLDYIRQTKVVEKEHGGITQHIGAYQIDEPRITFIDTPGHAAFRDMRARGGKVADIVILVVAANDGVKPQTVESIEHIKEAGVPFIVAINKIDLEGADVDKVKQELIEHEVVPDDKGGEVVTVPISAVQGTGVEQLLEMISLVAEMHDLSSDPEGALEAVVIESELDKRRGPVASVVVKQGTLKTGDLMHAEVIEGKVKALFNYLGQPIDSVGPSGAAQVLGFNEVPPVGAQVHLGLPSELPVTQETGGVSQVPDEKHLPVIIKTDVAGSAEAIRQEVPNDVVVVSEGVGEISEADILLAKTTGAQVAGFNVKAPKSVLKLAETEDVKVKSFKVIYNLLDYLEDQKQRLIDPLYGIVVTGEAEVAAEFKINKVRVAGCKLVKGQLLKDDSVLVMRNEEVIKKVKVKTLQQGKDEVNKVGEGEEFGIVFTPYVDFQVGDKVLAYKIDS